MRVRNDGVPKGRFLLGESYMRDGKYVPRTSAHDNGLRAYFGDSKVLPSLNLHSYHWGRAHELEDYALLHGHWRPTTKAITQSINNSLAMSCVEAVVDQLPGPSDIKTFTSLHLLPRFP